MHEAASDVYRDRQTYVLVKTRDGWRVEENIRPAPAIEQASSPAQSGAHPTREMSGGNRIVAPLVMPGPAETGDEKCVRRPGYARGN